jgi:hypothetical protein
VEVPILANETNSKLLPGTWTWPQSAVGLSNARLSVTVGPGQVVTNTDFGWWFKYGSGWGSTNSSVYGALWHDLCAYTPGDPIPDPIPTGCKLFNGVLHADGVRQPGEPGIPGVTVWVGPGVCPSVGLASAVTDANGFYHIDNLAPGKYCVSISSDHDPANAAILEPGQWTVVPGGAQGFTYRSINLTAGVPLSQQDFAWDYDNLPAQIHVPYFVLAVNAYCRHGPGENYEISTYGLVGQSYHIEGRSEDWNWFYVHFSDTLSCWMASGGGTHVGDLGDLPVVPAPEPPVVSCGQYTAQASCQAQNACIWKPSIAGPGRCTNK